MALDLKLLTLGQTYLDLAITLNHCLEAVLDLFFGSSKLIENSKSFVPIAFVSVPVLSKFVQLVSKFHKQRRKLLILQMCELYLSNVW
jgi:hypothetical protein